MALSLPKAKTLFITANDGTNSETIELTTKVAQLNPLLQVPSIIDLIRNTSVKPSSSMAQNTRIYGMDKNAYSDIVAKDGKVTDPRAMTTATRDLLVKQLTPRMVGAKYGTVDWDNDTEGLEDVLGRSLGQHIQERRVIKEQDLFEEFVTAIDAVTITGDPTTFETGAHVETNTATTSEEAYKLFTSMVSKFRKIGLKSAVGVENIAYKHARGIAKQDILVVLTPEFEALLLGKQGVFASESGNKLFRDAGIKKILGVNVTSEVTLPAKVDALCLTTGINGALSHEQISVGTSGKIIIDPTWSFAKRLDLVDAFTMGIVYDFLGFALKSA